MIEACWFLGGVASFAALLFVLAALFAKPQGVTKLIFHNWTADDVEIDVRVVNDVAHVYVEHDCGGDPGDDEMYASLRSLAEHLDDRHPYYATWVRNIIATPGQGITQ